MRGTVANKHRSRNTSGELQCNCILTVSPTLVINSDRGLALRSLCFCFGVNHWTTSQQKYYTFCDHIFFISLQQKVNSRSRTQY